MIFVPLYWNHWYDIFQSKKTVLVHCLHSINRLRNKVGARLARFCEFDFKMNWRKGYMYIFEKKEKVNVMIDENGKILC